nr:reverse transcriptase domain-containing protein [Tanacetum cinerariifolium]
MACIEELEKTTKSKNIEDQMLVLMRRQVETELKFEKKFRELCEEVSNAVKEREDVVEELERLSGNHVVKESTRLLRRGQKRDFDKMTCLQIMVNESHLGVREKRTFVKEKQEKDKIETKPDKSKIKLEAWKSPTMSKSNHKRKTCTASLGERPGEAFCCTGLIDKRSTAHLLLKSYREADLINRFKLSFVSSSRLTRDQSSNPSSSQNTTPKGRNHRSSKQSVENSNLEEHLPPVVTLADNRTMAELLRAPTEGYAKAIVVPPILDEQFELKHSLINMMTADQFFVLEKDNPHDHICWFNKITSTIKYRDVPNSVVKLILFPFSLAGAARRWLEKEPPRSITTWEDLVSKFINEFFPPQELQISVMKSQISNNGSMNLFMRLGIDTNISIVLVLITVRNSRSKPIISQVKSCNVNSNSEIAKLTHAVNQQTSAMTTAMTAMLKQFQATPPPAPVKAVEEICVTCGVAHPYYQCLAANGNTFLELRNNIQGYISAATVNYNQGILGSGSLPSNTVANPKGKLKAITTHSGLVTDGPTAPTPYKCSTPEVDERVEETHMDPNLTEYTIKVPPPPVQKYKPSSQREFVVHQRDPHYPNIPYPSRMLKQKPQEKDEVQIQKFWQMFKQLHVNITLADALILMLKDVFVLVGKFTFPADFVIVDYESDPRVPLILGRPFLRTARTLIYVHGKEMILRDGDERLTLNTRHDTSSYLNQPLRELINLINIFNVSSEDFLEDLFLHQPSGNPTFSPHPKLTSPEVNHDFHDSEGCIVLFEKLPDIDSTQDLHPHFYDNPLSGSTTYFSNSLLEEFTDELTLITYPSDYDDNLQFDIESDLKEIEFLLYQGKDSILKDSIDKKDLANLDDNFVDPIHEMFTDEHTPDYSYPLKIDEYEDDFLEVESNSINVNDASFDSKEEKIKEFKLLIDELDLPCDFLPSSEYDSFNSLDFSRVDVLPSPNN